MQLPVVVIDAQATEGKGNWVEDSRGGTRAAVAVIGNGKSGDLTHFTYLLK